MCEEFKMNLNPSEEEREKNRMGMQSKEENWGERAKG